jgi:hypothetical protein
MRPTEIPRDYWPAFCSEFSRRHHGQFMTLSEVSTKFFAIDPQSAERYARPLATPMALDHVATRRANGDPDLMIIASVDSQQVTRILHHLARLFSDQNTEGARGGLAVETRDGRTVLIRFRPA